MLLRPKTVQELQASLESARQNKQRVTSVALDAFTEILEYNPEDLTVSVQAGISLEGLQMELVKSGQWLPIDPPKGAGLSMSAVLQENSSGPRRYGYGTIREHLIGLKAMMPDGKIIKSGGKVVKNVAGYDLQKLFVGSHGSLGIILEAVFKLRPLSEVERFWELSFTALTDACAFVRKIVESPLEPVVLDLHHLSAGNFVVVVGLAGTRDEVEWQDRVIHGLGRVVESSLKHEEEFWRDPEPVQKLSVLPTRLCEAIEQGRPSRFVARAGNGIIYCRGGTVPAKATTPAHLMQRIKDTFDPNRLLPDYPL